MEGTATTTTTPTAGAESAAKPAQAMTTTPAPVKLPETPTKTAPSDKSQAAVDTPKETKAAPAPAKEELFEVVVDGKPAKMTREELIRHASLGKQAYSKFEEAAKLRKEADDKLGKIKTPKDAMRFLTDPKNGYDANEVRTAFEEWYAETFIAPETMTEEQKEIARLKKQNEEYERDRKERELREKEAEEKRLDEMGSKTLQQEITKIVDESGLPKTKFTTSRIAYWIRVNESKGISAPKELIISQVKKEAGDIVKSMVAATGGDAERIIQVLGEDVVKLIRKHDIEQIRKRRGQPASDAKPTETFEKPTEDGEDKWITPAEVKRRARLFK